MTTSREIRENARQSVYALLDAKLSADDGDLFVATEGYSEAGLDVFRDEVRCIMKRIWPT